MALPKLNTATYELDLPQVPTLVSQRTKDFVDGARGGK